MATTKHGKGRIVRRTNKGADEVALPPSEYTISPVTLCGVTIRKTAPAQTVHAHHPCSLLFYLCLPLEQATGSILRLDSLISWLVVNFNHRQVVTPAIYFRSQGQLVPAHKVRFAHWLEEGSLVLLDLTKAAAGRTAWNLLRICEPAHLQNSGLLAGILARWMSLSNLVRQPCTNLKEWVCNCCDAVVQSIGGIVGFSLNHLIRQRP